jgi:glutathione S-transferase
MIKDLPFELEIAIPGSKKGPRGTRSEHFLKEVNHRGTVPVMDDGGFKLTESCAIMAYLADKHRWQDLYPPPDKDGGRARARVDEYMHSSHRSVREFTTTITRTFFRPDTLPGGKFPDWTPRCNPSTDPVLQRVARGVDRVLAERSFLAGEAMTIADLSAYTELGQCAPWFCDVFDFSPYPNIERWLEQMRRTPKHDEVHALQRLPDFYAGVKKRAAEQWAKAEMARL